MDCEETVYSTANNISNSTSVIIVRVIYTVSSAIGVSLESLIVIILLFDKAYKSSLQRLFIWIVIALLVHDAARFSSIGYAGQNLGCKVTALVFFWSYWSLYLLFATLLLYMATTVYIVTRPNSPVVNHISISKTFLEVVTVLGTVMLPIIVLWNPLKNDEYGFNGHFCALKNNTKMNFFLQFTPPELVGLVSIVVALGLALLYCTLPKEKRQLKNVRNVIKNLVISLLVVLLYVATFNITEIVYVARENPKKETSYAIILPFFVALNIERVGILIGCSISQEYAVQ